MVTIESGGLVLSVFVCWEKLGLALGWESRDEAEADIDAFQLEVWTEVELSTVVAWILGVGLHRDLRLGKRTLGFNVVTCSRIGDILLDPTVQPQLHVIAFFKGTDFVAHDRFEKVGESAAGEEVR